MRLVTDRPSSGANAGPAADRPPAVPAEAVTDEVTVTEQSLARGEELNWEQLVEEARRLGPDPRFADLDDDRLVETLCRDAAAIAAATCRWLELLGELIVRGVWADEGARTPGVWLSWKLGVGAAASREQARVALRLRDLPEVRRRFAEGTLSYSKVRAITRGATPDIQELLLSWADHATAAQMESIVRGLRTAQRARRDAELEGRDPRYRTGVRQYPDGTATLTLRGPVEEVIALHDGIDRLAAALVADRERPERGVTPEDASHDDLPDDDVPDEDVPTGRVTAADRVEVLGHVVAAAVASDVPVDTSGLDRTTLVVQVDGADLAVDPAPGPDIVPVRDSSGRIRAMDRRVLRRLACDAGIVPAVLDRDGSPLDLGRRSRNTTAALRRAVHLRDHCCTYPGCGATRHLHVHHVQFWSEDGPTDLDNLALLCARHHRFVHDHDLTIEVRPDGDHRFRRLGAGDAIVRHPRLPTASPEAVLGAPALRSGAASAEAVSRLAPRGPVERRFDLDTAVAILLQTHERSGPAPATAA